MVFTRLDRADEDITARLQGGVRQEQTKNAGKNNKDGRRALAVVESL